MSRRPWSLHHDVKLTLRNSSQQPSVESLKALAGSEPFLSSDELLIPVLADDAYLRAYPIFEALRKLRTDLILTL